MSTPRSGESCPPSGGLLDQAVDAIWFACPHRVARGAAVVPTGMGHLGAGEPGVTPGWG